MCLTNRQSGFIQGTQRGIAKIMSELSGLGNTIIVVEHDKDIIKTADWVVELGPEAGAKGGGCIFRSNGKVFWKTDTLTAQYIRYRGAEIRRCEERCLHRRSPIHPFRDDL